MSETGVPLRELLAALGGPVGDGPVRVAAAAGGLEATVRHVTILDPEEEPHAMRGDLLLAVGLRGWAAAGAVRAAGAAGAAAIAVKADTTSLRESADAAGVVLLSVRPEARWEQVAALAHAALDERPDTEPPDGGDLFSLAQTTAMLTGGGVSIEDSANRVLAYSRTSGPDEADELRRLSILGWQGPEEYMARLRDWGVFHRLRTTTEVVAIEERPDLGIRRRLAVGVHAGGRPLGTIWVQEGRRPLADRAEEVLLGAARVAALHLVRRRTRLPAEATLTRESVAGLLGGTVVARTAAAQLGLDPVRPVLVMGFAIPAAATDESAQELARTELANLVSVYAAARHSHAQVAPLGTRLYVVLSAPPAEAVVLGWAREIATAAHGHLGLAVRGAVGDPAPRLAQTATARESVDRVLDAMAAGGVAAEVAALSEVRPEVLHGEVQALLSDHRHIRDPRLTALRAHDAEHATEYTDSVLAWLDALGDVRSAAAALHIHPNTLRYRIRRAAELTGLDWDDPKTRLLAALLLRLPG
ncbi:PucR family transcriptional regulator [Embleya sp. NBC_00896]|uniref:PucR family transcriptional regulator n=1 Tax=Embleya sp. NBC_00896 TaxID=2975961 RepID=UPI00386F5050|nr:helix-turn-helix domain-containing protein [Embleya sp. NBC_00896]